LTIIAKARLIIAAGKLTINNNIGVVSVKRGKKNIDPNQPADKLTSQSELTS
jgi:hypothetical protein